MTLQEGSLLALNLKYNKKDNESFEKLYKKYFNELYSFVIRTFKNIPLKNVHDLVIDSFLMSINKINQFDDNKSSYKTWLYTICFNECLKFNKRNIEILVDNRNFDLLGLNKSINGNTNKLILNSLKYYENENENRNRNVNISIEKCRLIKKQIYNFNNELLKQIAIKYFINNYSHSDMNNYFNLPSGTIKSKITKIKKLLISNKNCKYKNIDIEKYIKKDKIDLILSKIDISILYNVFGKELIDIYIKYRVDEELNIHQIKTYFNYKHSNDAYKLFYDIENYLLEKYV